MKLKQLRENAKFTQEELAQKLNLSRSTLRNYENATREPPIDFLIKFANFFDVSLDFLCERENNRILSENKKMLINIIEQLTDTECRKLYNYAEGIIMNRQAEQRKSIYKILKEEENNG